MLFWIIVITLALVCGAILAMAMLRGRAGTEPPAAYDLRVYRDQLREVERDRARGVIGDEEAERLRAEVSRRILSADAQLRATRAGAGQPRRLSLATAALALLVLGGGSALLYAALGEPGRPDLPLEARIAASEAARADRLDQAAAEARFPAVTTPREASDKFLELMDKLRDTVRQRPDDLRGLGLLARNEAALGNMTAARKAQERVVAVKGPEADANDYALLADLMISAAGGYVSKEAETAMRATLARDPRNPWARYYLGHYLVQVDRPDMAFRTWKQLLDESRPEAPWVSAIRARIEQVARLAGVQFRLARQDGAAPGPNAADMQAAGDMSQEDRTAMIRGMVGRLAGRLEEEGGTAQEWARLINAYGVLSESDKARAAWEEAARVFDGDPQGLETVRGAARQAGLIE